MGGIGVFVIRVTDNADAVQARIGLRGFIRVGFRFIWLGSCLELARI